MGKGLADLDGKVSVVTGAASGIGRALAVGLWQKGCRLALIDCNEEGLRKLQAELPRSGNRRAISLHIADVGNELRMKEVASEVVDTHQTVNLLINNAGIGHEAPFPQTSLETFEHVMAVNLWGMIYGCHFFMPHLAKAEQAYIVNLSSLFGIVGMAGQSAYCTSKFAVRGFSESLWEELRDTTIGLTVVHPGSVATNIMKTSKGDDPQLMLRLADWFEKNAIPPQAAAAQIIAAIEKGKSRVLITREAVFADCVKRLMPVLGNKVIGNLVIRMLGLEDMREKRRLQWQKTMVNGDPWN